MAQSQPIWVDIHNKVAKIPQLTAILPKKVRYETKFNINCILLNSQFIFTD